MPFEAGLPYHIHGAVAKRFSLTTQMLAPPASVTSQSGMNAVSVQNKTVMPGLLIEMPSFVIATGADYSVVKLRSGQYRALRRYTP